MSDFDKTTSGSIGGLIAGIAMIAAGIGVGVYPTLRQAPARLSEFVAVGIMMLGAFVVVYQGHELRRKRLR
ncbi:hypothetical protein WJ78_17295 [Burkholderia ubonensis]|uniref:hypothetical protein n=1 Tax=Burkholderia ubonensis TaxID=101571 RepID=UPI00075AB942|nr:hypothetical protein [Burkholderia ubonensis]KVD78490.1 hypothetical protein WI89_30660 [Burkholderia ubonensis]KVM71475.1 hypothetical protein WJ60_08085 [Burkholderia ubonensis]KVO64886.1 hypothetical protein WJ78_17295 [Burkholderia ubonensis]KVP89884.1 hypothetical protein WJ97_23085 [Burkholderia ubonensis]KVX95776.1 hypothetical protein WL08_20875 [Burkholderia ubonensis]